MKLSSLRRSLSLLGLLAVFASQAAVATAGTLGGISGIVSDEKTGAPLAGVHVEITSPSQSITVTTDAHGHYIAFSLQPDDYTLTLEKTGYDSRAVSGFSVFADQTQQYDLKLSPESAGST
ncbi:MAG: carboxypeptidase-like regulatory domain-containing protein, partial [Candidatus Cybelea sp.]